MRGPHHEAGCHIERLPDSRTYEFKAYAPGLVKPPGARWQGAPGEVRYGADGLPRLLHFAPGRWLVPDPDPDTMALVHEAVDSGIGACMDVQGKWAAMILSGNGVARVLSSAADIAAILTGRGCAAVTLFDCPAVIVNTGAEYRVWVASSYAADFAATFNRLSQAT